MKYSEINIIGGSAFGIFLALSLRQKNENDKININIFEKSESILNSWSNIHLDSKKFNRGFFGIEIPRAEEFKKLLGNEFISTYFKVIPNYKLLLIDSFLIPYKYFLKDMSIKYRDDIQFLINNKIRLSDVLKTKEFSDNSFLELIKICSKRYSEECCDSSHLFYPWFFPIEAFEDITNISSQTTKSSPSEYLIPKSGVFLT